MQNPEIQRKFGDAIKKLGICRLLKESNIYKKKGGSAYEIFQNCNLGGHPQSGGDPCEGYGYHWWNMAYVGSGLYHVDACPRRSGGKLCLLMDVQLKTYSANRRLNSHIWDYVVKPKSATKVIAYY